MTALGEIFAALSQLMGVCPCCGELFYLSDARPYYEGHKPHCSLDNLRAEEYRLQEAEERLDELEDKLRERAAKAGLRATKRLLRKIDPVFSGAGYDPQDVKIVPANGSHRIGRCVGAAKRRAPKSSVRSFHLILASSWNLSLARTLICCRALS